MDSDDWSMRAEEHAEKMLISRAYRANLLLLISLDKEYVILLHAI
jgi:hypothetical protein